MVAQSQRILGFLGFLGFLIGGLEERVREADRGCSVPKDFRIFWVIRVCRVFN